MCQMALPPTRDVERSQALVDRPRGVGLCSTRPTITSDHCQAGVDTIRYLFETRESGPQHFEIEALQDWRLGSIPALGLTWAEGHPAPGRLATPAEVAHSVSLVHQTLDQHLGVLQDRGCSRIDSTVTHRFNRPEETRAFIAGMAAFTLPRTETTRRGHPVHSISWTHPKGKKILARCYDKGTERGGEPWELARLEDQRRFGTADRPTLDAVSEPGYARSRFESRFGPIRKAVEGVRAASFPVVAQELADQARYGYRTYREVERLAGALVILNGGGADAYKSATLTRRRRELREAGFVVVDDMVEHVEVNLANVVEAALESEAWV